MDTRLKILVVAMLATVMQVAAAATPDLSQQLEHYTTTGEWQVRSGQHLLSILRATEPGLDPAALERRLREVVAENPGAFHAGNPDLMFAGVTLKLAEPRPVEPEPAPEPVPPAPREVGKVQTGAEGFTATDTDGRDRDLNTGDPVYDGDTLNTATAPGAEVRFNDGSSITLRERTGIRVERFDATPDVEGRRYSVISLLLGGVRTITGQIGRLATDVYEIRTPVATMGVRGTEYGLIYCTPEDCVIESDGSDEKPKGTYAGVKEGAITVTNDTGTAPLNKGEFFHVVSKNSVPKRIPPLPGFFGPGDPPPRSWYCEMAPWLPYLCEP